MLTSYVKQSMYFILLIIFIVPNARAIFKYSPLLLRGLKIIICILSIVSLHLSADSIDVGPDLGSADLFSTQMSNAPSDELYIQRPSSILKFLMMTRPKLLERPECYLGKLVPGDLQADNLFNSIYNRRIVFSDGSWAEFYYLPFAATSWGGVTSYCVRDNSVFFGSGEVSISFSAEIPVDDPGQVFLRSAAGEVRLAISAREPACIYRRCARALPTRIAFIGNSITFHPPKESIGWSGHWGMAASTKDSDYVHIIAEKLRLDSIATYASGYWERNIKSFNLASLKNNITSTADLGSFAPDLVVINIGENIANDAYSTDDLEDAVLKLVAYVRAETGADVVLVDSFYQQANVNRSILIAAIKAQTRWVGMRRLAGVPEYRAHEFFENDSVGSHPSDLGMAKIASLILEVIE